MADTPVTPTDINLAAIIGAHGVAGEVRLKLFGEGWESLKTHKSFLARHKDIPSDAPDSEGRTLTPTKLRSDNKGGAVARFKEVADRNAAEALRGTMLSVARDNLPPLEAGEFYLADLLGLAAVSASGKPLGQIIAVENFGATDIVEIAKDPVPEKGMKTFMVPLTKEAVPQWDDKRLIVADSFADE